MAVGGTSDALDVERVVVDLCDGGRRVVLGVRASGELHIGVVFEVVE
jgi:hypothetical protein